MIERRSRQGGFTLIEVIGALVIFSAGVLVAASLSSRLTDQLTGATLRTEAAAVARQTLDSLATVSYDEFSTGTVESEMGVGGRTYTRRWTVSQTGFRMLEIVLEVDPPGSDTLRTFVVEPW